MHNRRNSHTIKELRPTNICILLFSHRIGSWKEIFSREFNSPSLKKVFLTKLNFSQKFFVPYVCWGWYNKVKIILSSSNILNVIFDKTSIFWNSNINVKFLTCCFKVLCQLKTGLNILQPQLATSSIKSSACAPANSVLEPSTT